MINLAKYGLPSKLPGCNLADKKQGFRLLWGGLAIALLLGVLATILSWEETWITWVLILGLLVGILNIFHEEGVMFLVAMLTLAFMVNLLTSIVIFPAWALNLFYAALYLLTPAATVVGLKVLYALAR